MLLFELFNKPQEWKSDEGLSGGEYSASFKTPSGKTIVVYIHHRESDPDTYEVEFYDDDEDDQKKRFAITGGGEAIVIMSTVLKVMGEFLQAQPDSVLFFSSSAMSRSALYDRMVKRAVKSPFIAHTELQNQHGAFWIGKPENVKAAVQRDIGDAE